MEFNSSIQSIAVCNAFRKSFETEAKLKTINTVEMLAGLYYIFLLVVGFRNMYVFFWKQKQYSTLIFPLMYVLAQSVCILQATQCFMFFGLNERMKACWDNGGISMSKDETYKILSKFHRSLLLLCYAMVCKACIGCVHMAQFTELKVKLEVIMRKESYQRIV